LDQRVFYKYLLIERMITQTIFREPALVEEINNNTHIKIFEKDEEMIRPGDEIKFIPIVLSGCIRVIRVDEDGNELFLYHLFPGQTCAMSLTCCQAGKRSMVKAVAEDRTEVMQIPVNLTSDWYRFNEWKAYISNNYQNRFAELMDVVDLIAFNHMDMQLWHYLSERARALNTHILEVKHQEIADELHTHREAVSRLLRTMEQKKLVRLGRNQIELLRMD
jgi:CRP/FNR family transcriptional regulator